MKRKIRIGIDLGGTNTAAGIVDQGGTLVLQYSDKTDTSSESAVVRGLADSVIALLGESGSSPDDVEMCGVACPGTVDGSRGIVEYSANLPLVNADIPAMLAELTKIPADRIRIANDADAAALGEFHAGAGRGTRDFMMITIGTGIGAGCIHNGELLVGHNHAGGELGHTVIVAGGEPCGCGRRGCAEKYCSASALVRLTKEAIAECESLGIHTRMADLANEYGKVSGRTPFIAAGDGDPAAIRVVEKYISYLACTVTNFINIFQPEVLAVGGGVSNEGERLLAPLRDQVYGEMYNHRQPREMYTRIVRAELGNSAGIIGAAMLPKLF